MNMVVIKKVQMMVIQRLHVYGLEMDFIYQRKKIINLDPKTHDRIHKMAPSPKRANLRSITPRGYSRAIFETFSK